MRFGPPSQRTALSAIGTLLVSLQLLVLYQLSKHTTVVDVSTLQQQLRPQPIHPQTKQPSQKQQPGTTRQEEALKTEKNPANVPDTALRKEKTIDTRTPDGSFNGIPLYYNNSTRYSSVSCVGENYQDSAWRYRSCEFRHFCFDTHEKDYVVFASPMDQEWHLISKKDKLIGTSTKFDRSLKVSLGGLNPKWTGDGWDKLKWFPKIINSTPQGGFYELPADYFWVPFHSFAGFNAGHLIWDDFLPIYTLLNMFGAYEFGRKPLLTRYALEEKEALWATCDAKDETRKKCEALVPKFLPVMGIDPDTFSDRLNVDFQYKGNKPRSRYICAKQGAAGIGMLTDHGIKAHGWERKDYETTHNMGRGPAFYDFRNFMLSNLGIPTNPLSPKGPFEITFSKHSSNSFKRSQNFDDQVALVEKKFDSKEVHVNAHIMKELSLEEQVSLASRSSIFVTSAGGGAVTATFLPRGASLIVFYVGDGTRENNRNTHKPARLDWDFFNNASHLRVHWLPTNTMDTPEGFQAFETLVRHELDIIKQL